MFQSNFHNYTQTTKNIILIVKLKDSYKLWHSFIPHIKKDSRYSLGIKIDSLFLEIMELAFLISCSKNQEKMFFARKCSAKIDMLKMFLQIMWEIKSLDNKKYIEISERINEAGKILGGWIKQISRTQD